MSTDREELQHEVDATREHLAETVDALGDKFDVAGRAKETAADPRTQAIGAAITVALVIGVVLLIRRRRS